MYIVFVKLSAPRHRLGAAPKSHFAVEVVQMKLRMEQHE